MNSLLEELNCETVFTIPVFGGIGVSEAVVVTWIIMAVLVVLCLCLVRSGKSRKETADVGNSRFRTLQFL